MNPNSILKKYFPEIAVFILFCVGTITISFFHEPCYNEFQAWAIAKDNIYNILFVIPHLEGHPPLWHLIIKFFQQFTDNPELTIKIPNLLFMFLAVWLLIFKSPFPRKIKLVIPFTYFIFYQNTIINRPYSLLLLFLFLAAVLYKHKNKHPFKFVLSLMLLSLTSAFGMLLATSITIAWLMEISDKEEAFIFLKSFIRDKRFYAMLCLFFFCLFLTIEIFPNSTVTATSVLSEMSFWKRILYFYFGLPADATVFNILRYTSKTAINFINLYNIMGCIFGLYLSIILFNFFKSLKHLYIFAIPYCLFLVFAYSTYLGPHHISILTFAIIFSAWCTYSEISVTEDIKNKYPLKNILIFICIIQIYWTAIASINDVRYAYSNGREISNFISKHKLTAYKIFVPWEIKNNLYDSNRKLILIKRTPGPIFEENEIFFEEKMENTNMIPQAIPVIPYFNKNVFYNFNVQYPDKLYIIHKYNTPEENQETKDIWVQLGKPDIILGNPPIETVFGEDYPKYGNYIQIKFFESGYIWKNKSKQGSYPLWVHKDLYDKMKDYE